MDATRDRLLMAAGEVFAEKGFEKATVREICQAANVQNIAAVNYYFGDKQRLYIESVKCAHQVQIDRVPLPNWTSDTPPEKKLHDFVETMVTRLTGDSWLPWQEQLMLREVANPTSAVAELVQQFIRPHFEVIQSIIDEFGVTNLSPVQRHQIAFSIVGQCLHYKVARPFITLLVGSQEMATYTTEQLTNHIYQFSLAAIKGFQSVEHRPESAVPRRRSKNTSSKIES
jgi:TetR/AcrR family transcriptional regulator, regulator of cefoperazone and chloramphenicol sensitivity